MFKDSTAGSPGPLHQDQLYSLLEHAPYGVIVASTQPYGPCFYLNPLFTRITGYTLADIPTTADWLERAYPNPEYRAYVTANWNQDVSLDNMYRDVHYQITHKNGEAREIQFRASPLGTDQMLVMLQDVTERMEAVRDLRDSEERYRSLVEASPDGIVVHDGHTLLFANPAARKILGWPLGTDPLGRPLVDFVHPDMRDAIRERIRATFMGKSVDHSEEMFLRRDGSAVPVEVVASLVRFHGEPASQVIFRDITSRTRAREVRLDLERRLQRSQRLESLAVLAGGIAHDFNNLLMSVLGNAELARVYAANNPKLLRRVLAIETAARRAADLSCQMLAYAGRGNLSTEPVNLGSLVKDMSSLLEVPVYKNVRIKYDIDDSVPLLEADATQIRQVLMNLVTNAGESFPAGVGNIVVSTGKQVFQEDDLKQMWLGESLLAGEYAYIQVKDDGGGMDKQTLTRIFDPFFSTKFTGRGLGLAAVLGIVRGHGGAIRVCSEPGEGTCFQVLLPIPRDPLADLSRSTPSAQNWQGKGTVLLVDDEDLVLETAMAMLEMAGFRVLTAHDGVEALAMLEDDDLHIDCILLDLTMPVMDGDATFHEIRRRNPLARVILCSGYPAQDISARFHDTRPNGFLQKPYGYKQMIAVLKRALQGAPCA